MQLGGKRLLLYQTKIYKLQSLNCTLVLEFPLEDAVILTTCREDHVIIVAKSHISDMRGMSCSHNSFRAFLNARISEHFNFAEIVTSGEKMISSRALFV
mmetsp:Transcript_6254/g.6957  ORF Transcript_6254/g.6957 Transcript_6254/m.6957 type:complete len:99 (-) Transcript_6254:1666-1962(-)